MLLVSSFIKVILSLKIMKSITFFAALLGIFFGTYNFTQASTINVTVTVNGQESAPVQKGDSIHVAWTSTASVPVEGCKASGEYNTLTKNGSEWVNTAVPASGSVDLKVENWDSTATYLSVYCWLPGWPNKAESGYNMAQGQFVLLDKRVAAVPKGPVPIVANLFPSSGTVGTKIQVVGSGFTNENEVSFVASTNPVSKTAADKVSPFDGESDFENIHSIDGKTLIFTVPSYIIGGGKEDTGGIGKPIPVTPGMYYLVVQTENGKSGVAYFKVTAANEPTANFVSIPETLILNRDLALGDLGPEVTKLQAVLARDTSIYPEGLITGYYGGLTQKAVQRFQCKYGIACSSNAQVRNYGIVDMSTRKKMEEVFGKASATPSPEASGGVNSAEQKETNELIDRIRQLLNLF